MYKYSGGTFQYTKSEDFVKKAAHAQFLLSWLVRPPGQSTECEMILLCPKART